jgi:hypothetical protein
MNKVIVGVQFLQQPPLMRCSDHMDTLLSIEGAHGHSKGEVLSEPKNFS